MSADLSIQFRKECEIQTTEDLKTDLEPFCDGPCDTERSPIHDTTVKAAAYPDKAPEKEADDEETSESVKDSKNENNGHPDTSIVPACEMKMSTFRKDHEPQIGISGYKKCYENGYRTNTYRTSGGSGEIFPSGGRGGAPRAKVEEKEEEEESIWKKVGLFALKTAVVSGAVLGGAALALKAVGFESKGPRGGSLASNYQSRNYGDKTPAGSTFSTMQRAGMVGPQPETIGAVVAGSAAVVAIVSAFKEMKN